jgi:hypothetical protein
MNIIKHWTALENKIQEELVAMQEVSPLHWVRFYDTKSAGNFMPSQPADFGVLFNGHYTYIEAKYSAHNDSLRNNFAGGVSDKQLASARLAERAGGSYWVLFYSRPLNTVELWPGGYLRRCRADSKLIDKSYSTVMTNVVSAVLHAVTTRSSQDTRFYSN